MTHVRAVHRSSLTRRKTLKAAGFSVGRPQPRNRNAGSFEQRHLVLVARKPGPGDPTPQTIGVRRPHPELWLQKVGSMRWHQESRQDAGLPHTVRLLSQSGRRVNGTKNDLQKPGQKIPFPPVFIQLLNTLFVVFGLPTKDNNKVSSC